MTTILAGATVTSLDEGPSDEALQDINFLIGSLKRHREGKLVPGIARIEMAARDRIKFRPRMGRISYNPGKAKKATEFRTANICLRAGKGGMTLLHALKVQKALEGNEAWSAPQLYTRISPRAIARYGR